VSWEERLVAPGSFGPGPLAAQVGPFLAWQAARWPRLAEARAGLTALRVREIRAGARRVEVQFNPGRAVSTTAPVDPGSVAARPCFLCPGALPPEERGLAFGPDWVLLANPAPILPDHLVLAHRAHRPQAVGDALGALVDLAAAAAGRLAVIYNGPACGASAPDHLHLQAVAAGLLPEERAAWDADPGGAGCCAWAVCEPGRGILCVAGEAAAVRRALGDAVSALAAGAPHEPLLNLLCAARGRRVLGLLFPRAAHRPACFFAPEPARRLVSPGALDMGGALVTVREPDFEALDSAAVEVIYREVTPPLHTLRAVLAPLPGRLAHA
jgi:hypothetical protein